MGIEVTKNVQKKNPNMIKDKKKFKKPEGKKERNKNIVKKIKNEHKKWGNRAESP